MNSSVSSKTYWTQILDRKPRQFARSKNGVEREYIQENAIGSGNTSVVYSLIPVNQQGKSKAIKIAKEGEFTKEYELLKRINSNGNQVGIVSAPKDLIAKKIMVMCQYSMSFHKALQTHQCSDQDIADALKQILRGMQYLKNNNFYHGDIVSSNIFIREGKGVRSFHLGDFGHGEDLSEF